MAFARQVGRALHRVDRWKPFQSAAIQAVQRVFGAPRERVLALLIAGLVLVMLSLGSYLVIRAHARMPLGAAAKGQITADLESGRAYLLSQRLVSAVMPAGLPVAPDIDWGSLAIRAPDGALVDVRHLNSWKDAVGVEDLSSPGPTDPHRDVTVAMASFRAPSSGQYSITTRGASLPLLTSQFSPQREGWPSLLMGVVVGVLVLLAAITWSRTRRTV